jgi:hypothetical protein
VIFGQRRAQQEQALALMDARITGLVALYLGHQNAVREQVEGLRTDVTTRNQTFEESAERIAMTCGRLFDDIEADRRERRSLLGALDRLTLAMPQTVFATPPRYVAPLPVEEPVASALHDGEIVVTTERGVEVRCRFGDRWVDGFEVCETVADDDRTRYRLRRRSDGSILPTLFDAADIRPPSTRSAQTERADRAARRWSRA